MAKRRFSNRAAGVPVKRRQTESQIVPAARRDAPSEPAAVRPATAATPPHCVPDHEFTSVRAELEAAIRARDEFIAIAAHELRNPMGAIGLYVDSLLLTARKNENACSKEMIRDLERLESRIRQFVKRASVLLDVTRLSSGSYALELGPVDLSELARAVLSDFAQQFELARCKLESSVASGVRGHWDEIALEQVLTNLISNAIKYGAGAPIRVSLTRMGSHAVFEVEDHGIGISEADQARIFEKFERAVLRRTQGGFGVGLWITRQIVEALGGRIDVESRTGAGSNFRVVLPITNVPEPDEAAEDD
jgi:signal transduction histidine kinase